MELEAKRFKYCTTVCGGKCCYLHDRAEPSPVRCPKLAADNSCSIYAERYGEGQVDVPLVMVGQYRSKRYRTTAGRPVYKPFWCGKIEQIIAAGLLPPETAKGCVYVHPELLENVT